VPIVNARLPEGFVSEDHATANAAWGVQVMLVELPPPDVRMYPDVPAVVGKLKL
jgi:hypothetical protein